MSGMKSPGVGRRAVTVSTMNPTRTVLPTEQFCFDLLIGILSHSFYSIGAVPPAESSEVLVFCYGEELRVATS